MNLGNFAIRGGILDIYSFGNEKPYRIELFGNEVDSIRIFDPETQLSERKLLQVNIIPNVETQFETGEKVSLIEFLPENTVVWMEDWDFIKEKIEDETDGVSLFTFKEIDENATDNLFVKELNAADFVNAQILEDEIRERHIVEIGKKAFFGSSNKNVSLSLSKALQSENELYLNEPGFDPASGGNNFKFETKPQPSFNRQFDLLIKNLQEFEKKDYNIFIFADNAKQLERLHSIFTDLKAEIQITPIPFSINEGFIDDDLKLVCYTDHQIFQRYHKYKVKQAFSKNKALTLKTLRELQPGDYVSHIDHGVGVYSGLQKIDANGKMQEAVRIQYKDGDLLVCKYFIVTQNK